MTRVRRRLAISGVIALVIAIVGGGPLAHDPRTHRLNTSQGAQSGAVSQHLALAPLDPVSSDGAVGDLAPAIETIAASRKQNEAVIKQAPAQFEGPAPKSVAPPAALSQNSSVSSQSTGTGTWAVVVGVNDYPGSQDDLSSAVNDADDMAQALDAFGVSDDHVIVLRDGQVTRNTLLDSVGWLASHAGPDSVAGFFYAGHVRKTSAGNEEIVTSDGSAVSDRELANALSRVRANRSWVAIAACYGGGFTEVLRPGRVLSAAASADSLAYENSTIGRSYMVEYMIRQAIIQGRASATVQTAFNYAVAGLQRDHPGREPVQVDHGDGALDLRPPGSTTRSPAEQPEPAPEPSPPPTTEPPASDRPGDNQKCTRKGLVRYCPGR
ncbi:MAG: caspase family protein [Actinobacteria bacterium]|nr:caspase family protein [Actinomycetota bacterium]